MKFFLQSQFNRFIYSLACFIFISFNCLAVNDVRIYEIYGGGGNAGATYNDDFIVIYNSSSSPVSLNGWSLQYASATSSTWSKLDIPNISILAKGFILVSITTSGAVGAILPDADLVWPAIPGGDGLSQTNGKIALMPNTTLITTSAPVSPVDFVGYGSANASEGSPAPSPTNVRAIVRKQNPGDSNPVDTDNNSADFVLTNSAAPSVIRPSNSNSFPVKLSKFSAQISQESNVSLNWETASETSFSYFEIQRSGDALGFETIGKEFSKGNNVDQNTYEFLDEKPLQGQNYYRLKQVDIDGSVEFSKIIAIQINDISAIVFYPNPVVDVLEISGVGINQVEKIRIFNSIGKEIENLSPLNNRINISNLDAQILLIEAKLKDGSIYKKRIVKL